MRGWRSGERGPKEGKRGETWAATYMTDLFSFSDLKKSSNLFFQKMQYWLIKVMVSGLTALAGMRHVEKGTGNGFCTRVGAGI